MEYKALMNLQDRLLTLIQARALLTPGTKLVVAVSGGADSLALLHLLAALRERLAITLHVATLDHRLRGAAGAEDAAYVAALARARSLEVTVGEADVPELARQQHLSIEAAARRARYDFLSRVAGQVGTQFIATAHHAGDQSETILHNLLRGAGLTGLRGMAYSAPVPGHPDLTLIRPLLGVTRAEIEAYCREHGLQPRHDATNDDLQLTRNRLRHETLPYLRQIAPQVDRHLAQLGEIASLESDFVAAALQSVIHEHVTQHERQIAIPRPVFAALHPALQRRFVVWAAQQLGQGTDVGYIHITAAVELALHGEVGARAQLKGHVQLRVDYEQLIVEDANAPSTDDLPLVPENAEYPITFPAEIGLNSRWVFHALLSPIADPNAVGILLAEGSSVVLRGRRTGDRFPSSKDALVKRSPLNNPKHKLNEWMIDHKVPRHLRQQLPLVVVNGQVAAVWWQGWVISRYFMPNSGKSRVGYVLIKRK